MEKIKSLNRYQKGILIFMIAMACAFAIIYPKTISKVGFEYNDKILVPSEENGSTVYTGKINGENARFIVSADKVVEFWYGEKVYGPYTAKEDPTAISFYVASFEDRDYVIQIINEYNKGKPEEQQIEASDFLGSMMSGITNIINAISYVLIGFVSVSLIVSSIMIGIITYISVLERIKEIGILRALGASKRDVSRVFNAETLIIGLTAGLLGIGVTVLLNLPISFVIYKLAGIRGVAKLPWLGGVLLVLISMCLTLIAGLIPSKIASKKDPVVALRSE